ncbi:MAG: hypothetical protein PUE13_08285 [Clostridiales bacterium]|nr:hypothetical protein [Clostridiales bacterium]
MNVDTVIYNNVERLIEEYGLSESTCTAQCGLSANFFTNFRKGTTKHFKVCDVIELAVFFGVSLDYLCDYKNTRSDFFMPKQKMVPCDEKRLVAAFKKLDATGRSVICQALGEEIKNTRKRFRNRKG